MRCSENSDASQEKAGNGFLTQAELDKLPSDGGEKYNRLVFEKSPYLLQHATNPVDWYPWGDEAFEKALREDKPIFLSIGYSTCHWCHVMEHESFEDTTVAKLMNDAFVSVKVDREERPDIDQVYMAVCMAMTGSGGWPMTIIMTPEKEPFFAGTYFPKESKYQRIGMLDLVPRVSEAWRTERPKLLETANNVIEYLTKSNAGGSGAAPTESLLSTAFDQLSQTFDETYGGFGSGNKFPSPHNYTFLLRHWQRSGNERALHMVEKTLQAMRLGGMYDHVGFGFHRYSTDPQWLVPHFEKMLYDQALVARAYIEAYQATGNDDYARTAKEIFTYVLRDMTSPDGGFYSAEDADSEGEEGLFYLWTPDELIEILGAEDADFVIENFSVVEGGNFVDQASREKTGESILHLKKSLADLAEDLSKPRHEIEERWERIRQRIFAEREKRIHPLKDDKILTDWNGLMIAALATGAAVFGEPVYADAASKAADFVLTHLRDSQGGLLKRYRLGEAALNAHSEDYAFMIWGLLDLYEATFEVKYLRNALELNELFIADFWDTENGGFFFTSKHVEQLLTRPKEIYDGAIPSGNSVALLNLMRLNRITAREDFARKALAIGQAFSQQIQRAPTGHTQLMASLSFLFGPSYEIVISGRLDSPDTKEMLKSLFATFFPNKVVLFRPDDIDMPPIVELAAFTETQRSIDGKATAYVCQNYTCNLPTTDIDQMVDLLPKNGTVKRP